MSDDYGPLFSRSDPHTSAVAAEELVCSGVHAKQCRQVLEALRRHPGSTSAELAQRSGLDRFLCARRLPDLRRAGLVVRDEQGRLCSATGRKALVWRPA